MLLWPCLTVGAFSMVNIIVLHCICRKVVPTKDLSIIFTDFCFISWKHGCGCFRLLEGYKVPCPLQLPALCKSVLEFTL